MEIQKFEEELKSLENFLATPDAYQQPDFAAKSKRAALLREILSLDQKINTLENNLAEAESLTDDPELGPIAKEDVLALTTAITDAKSQLDQLLIPHDPEDDKPAIIEIRAGE